MLMSPAERDQVIRRVVKTAKGRVKLIAHIGAVGTDEALDFAVDCPKGMPRASCRCVLEKRYCFGE